MNVLGLDLGWKWIGRILAPAALPLFVRSDRLKMDPQDPWPVLERIMGDVRANMPARVAIEHAPFFARADASAAANAKMAHMHEPSSIMQVLLDKALRDLGYERMSLSVPLPKHLPERCFITIPRNTWAHRVRPHTQGGISDEMAIEAMRPYVAESSWKEMLSQDEIDAAGAALWWLVPAAAKKRAPRERPLRNAPARPVMTAEERAVRERAQARERKRAERGTLSLEQLAVLGCYCYEGRERRGGRHRENCPIHVGRALDALEDQIRRGIAGGPYAPADPPRPPKRLV